MTEHLSDQERIRRAICSMPLGDLMRMRLEPLLDRAEGLPAPLLVMAVGHVERALIRAALERCRGKIGKAAELLGIHRNTMRKKIEELEIDLSECREGEDGN